MIPAKEEMLAALKERIGGDLLEKFQSSAAAVCGLGGLGSNIAVSLARAGVGRLFLYDFDDVDVTNLNRQQYKASQIGMSKADALRENLLEIAPYTEIISQKVKITEDNALPLLKDADVICEAFDKAESKAMLCNLVLEKLPEKYLVAASGLSGLGTGNSILTRRVSERFYICGDGESDVDTCGTLFAPRVCLCASHQALAALRILAGLYDV
ncbi:MAG: thiamine biosynthesis protein ThiF [Oscillospiraceae bacterium]|nr:thiamine biosynthesis protein ThiF [Oscillospiraceae bacterium]